MQKLIDAPLVRRLRKKPKAVRVEIAFFSAIAVTGVIGLFWGALLPFRLNNLPQADGTVAEDDSLNSFFTSARSNLGQLIGSDDQAEASPETRDSVSGAYQEGVPEDYTPRSGYSFDEAPAVAPVDRREVLIGTSTSSR